MKFQRTAESFLDRFGAETSHWDPDSLNQLTPSVVPVVLLGTDRIDVERPVYSGAPHSGVVALEVSSVSVEGVDRDLEVMSIIASVSAATRIGLLTDTITSTLFLGNLTPPTMMLSGLCEGPLCEQAPSSGTRILRGTAAWGAAAGLIVPANSPLELVSSPLIVPKGVRLVVGLQDGGIACSAIFTWRELG